jgi:4-hydroxyphenylpyruvate dioxygenase
LSLQWTICSGNRRGVDQIAHRAFHGVMASSTLVSPRTAPAQLLQGWDHLEFWVGNARAVAHFFMSGFGFACTGYAGPETGVPDRVSYVLEQGQVRFVVTGGLTADSPVAAHVLRHGDGVRNLVWTVADVDAAFEAAVLRGAPVVSEPRDDAGDAGVVRSAAIATYGETRHVFVDRARYRGLFGPGVSGERLPAVGIGSTVGLDHIDHVVGNVEEGRLDEWVAWYERVLGFRQMKHFDADAISTEYSALRSTVVWNGATVVMPLNEPAEGRRKSQIQEYLETYAGPGVQHIALATADIVTAVDALKARGVRFLVPPATYYDDAKVRCAGLDVPWADLERLGILVDVDAGGHLLQVFTENVTDRPTVFIEVIQREGASGFGEGNFKALFEAIEREQARRGNL